MYWRSIVFSFLVVIILFPSASRAAPEVERASTIAAVTVFPDRAEVVRRIEAALPAGHRTLVLKGLPANLIAQSVRVRGAADASLRIGSVETKRHFEEAVVRAEERRLLAELESLQDQRRALDDRVAAARVQLNFVNAIGREGPKLLNQQMAEGRFDPEALGQALGLLGSATAPSWAPARFPCCARARTSSCPSGSTTRSGSTTGSRPASAPARELSTSTCAWSGAT